MAILILAVGLVSGLDVNSSQGLSVFQDGNKYFDVDSTGVEVFDTDLDLNDNRIGNISSFTNYYGSACPSGEVVADVNNDGTFGCVNVTAEVQDAYVSKDGDSMDGQLDMKGYEIIDIGDLQGTDIINTTNIESDAVTSAELDETDTYNLDWTKLAIAKTDITPSDVGLGNVENIAQSSMAGDQLTWDSTNNEIDLSGSLYGDEDAQDAVGTIMTGSGATSVNYDDANNQITVSSTDKDTNTQLDDEPATSIVDAGGFDIANVGAPDSASDAATKNYVDSQVSSSSCPSGYVRVPGSTKHGTEDFCVMKYEAKDDGSGNPVSQASGSPWLSIDQYDARKECRSLGSDYHLITESEWMTIADNVMRQPANWADGNIGSVASNGGGLYRGNVGQTDSVSCDVSNPADGTDSCSGKRTLQLSNGNYVWDLSGNVWEWTNGYMTTDGVPEPGANGWTEYTVITNFRSMEDEKPLNPSWNADNGIGRIYLDQSPNPSGNIHAVIRGGYYYSGADAGALSVLLDDAPSHAHSIFGFRCVADL